MHRFFGTWCIFRNVGRLAKELVDAGVGLSVVEIETRAFALEIKNMLVKAKIK